jgi:hypothetical protein
MLINFKQLSFDYTIDQNLYNALVVSCNVTLDESIQNFDYELSKQFKDINTNKFYKHIPFVRNITIDKFNFNDIKDFEYFKIEFFNYLRKQFVLQSLNQYFKSDKNINLFLEDLSYEDLLFPIIKKLDVFNLNNLDIKFIQYKDEYTPCPRCGGQTHEEKQKYMEENDSFHRCESCGYLADGYEVNNY